MHISGDLTGSKSFNTLLRVSVNLSARHHEIEANVHALSSIYAFRARTKTDYFAMGVLAIYVLCALIHTISTIIQSQSSRAWQRPEDFVALLNNSRQAPGVLANTCGGTSLATTRASRARVLAMSHEHVDRTADGGSGMAEGNKDCHCLGQRSEKETSEEKVQLVFVQERPFRKCSWARLEPDVKYGSVRRVSWQSGRSNIES